MHKALENPKTFNITPKPCLISDSQTSLALCCKSAVTLTLGTDLLVARVQDTFGVGSRESGHHYAPGAAFARSFNLLTCYNRSLASKITQEFYAPTLLKPRLENRITTPVANMKLLADKDLPHRNPKVIKYALVPGGHRANVFTATPTQPDQTKLHSSNLNYTGKRALQVDIPCLQPCGICDTAGPERYHPKDVIVLDTAKLKKNTGKSTFDQKSAPARDSAEVWHSISLATTSKSGFSVTTTTSGSSTKNSNACTTPAAITVPVEESEGSGGSGVAAVSLAAAVLSNFKGRGSRPRRGSRAARSVLKDCQPPAQDTNPWKTSSKRDMGILLWHG